MEKADISSRRMAQSSSEMLNGKTLVITPAWSYLKTAKFKHTSSLWRCNQASLNSLPCFFFNSLKNKPVFFICNPDVEKISLIPFTKLLFLQLNCSFGLWILWTVNLFSVRKKFHPNNIENVGFEKWFPHITHCGIFSALKELQWYLVLAKTEMQRCFSLLIFALLFQLVICAFCSNRLANKAFMLKPPSTSPLHWSSQRLLTDQTGTLALYSGI